MQAGRQAGRQKQSIVESHATCKIDRYKLNEHLENGLLLFKFETTHLISVASFSHLCTSISYFKSTYWALKTFGLAFRPDRDLKSWSFEEVRGLVKRYLIKTFVC